MLIVCPTCATSYMIDPTSVGPTGRAVRCARCKATWFAGPPKAAAPNVSAFVDGVIAEAEAQSSGSRPEQASQQNDGGAQPPTNSAASDDFGIAPGDNFPPAAGPNASPAAFEAASRNNDPAPRADETHDAFADTVAIADAPSLVPPIEHEPLVDAALNNSDVEENGSFVARRQRLKERRLQSKRMSRWTAIILVLFAFNVALIGARSEVVRYLPQTASLFAAVGLPVNLRNLRFDQVKITKEAQDGVNILIIEGLIVNTANKPTDVPRLRFSARNASGQDVYSWTALPSRGILGANESMEFRSRLAAPPADATDVMVRFFNAQDAASGAK
jgi:predicted Zn finger-like uncharacterized protein